ncbi:AAA family ATPase [Zhenpiania hominis]|uniref:AAA family ATPase n=1 Tax=Zhenpiania hominis TaxID=2763644 RepID=A0A923SQZ7_9FIRM|nr:AAA family ATPase [Zhenpiania hominis]
MKIEAIKIKNYRVFQDVKVENIPNMAVFLGMNGTGKTTFFDVFGFLHDALQTNIRAALAKRGGFREVLSRGQTGDIEFEIKFRPSEDEPLITYQLAICLNDKRQPAIKKEILRLRRGQSGAPWKVLEFSFGEGRAAEGEINTYEDIRLAERSRQQLDSPDILAIKGLGQFKEFVAVAELRRLIEDWYVSDFHVDEARDVREAGYSERVSTSGDNLALVAKYLYDNHREIFSDILTKMEQRVPGVKKVQAQETEDGRIVLRFQDGSFKDPFVSRFVSDGTIKMFTYLVLLNDPEKHALLCVEEPENQLYPRLLEELAEEFRIYSVLGGQVFISTHSPDFLNAVELEELYCLIKENGYTKIYKAAEDEQIRRLWEAGDLLGDLWRQDLLSDGVEKL